MNPAHATRYIIIVSLLFAAAIVASAYIFADRAFSQTLTYLLIALWFVPFAYLIRVKNQQSD